jgi:hypothetical protein
MDRMKTCGWILTCLLSGLLVGCSANAPGTDQAAAQSPVAARDAESTQMETSKPMESSADNSAPSGVSDGQLQGLLKAGMAYADFRNAVLANGWKPVVDPQCKANVVGGNHASLCAANPDLASCQVCDQMPELSACSGDGHCLVRFEKPEKGEVLEATGYGMIEDWSVPGDDSRLQLSKWEVSKSPVR